jgi:AbrB family looped-hinge helix DNA binding protein
MDHEMIITISKGQQVTIPASIREELGLSEGSKMELEKKKGKIILTPIGENLEEIFKETEHIKPKHDLTAEQMDKINEKMFR